MSQLNLPHGTDNCKVEQQKKNRKYTLRRIGKQSRESMASVLKKKRKAAVGMVAEREGFKTVMKQ